MELCSFTGTIEFPNFNVVQIMPRNSVTSAGQLFMPGNSQNISNTQTLEPEDAAIFPEILQDKTPQRSKPELIFKFLNYPSVLMFDSFFSCSICP